MADYVIKLPTPPAVPPRSPLRQLSKSSLRTIPSEQTTRRTDTAHIKLRNSSSLLSMGDVPSLYSSGSSLVSSTISNCRAIYPPDIFEEADTTQMVFIVPRSPIRRIGSIDQMLQFSDSTRPNTAYNVAERKPHNLSTEIKYPLAKLPARTKQACTSFWTRMQQKMSSHLLPHTTSHHPQTQVYEVQPNVEKKGAVSPITLCTKHIYKNTLRAKRSQHFADQEDGDITSVRVWWTNQASK